MPNKDNSVVPPPMMAMQITTDKPLWFYCKQKTPASHCGKGMTFSINATPEKPQGKFKELAISQNGATPAPPPDAPPAAPSAPATTVAAPAAPVATESATLVASSVASSPAAAPTGGVAPGSGTGSGDECACSCFCGTAAFPAADQGVGSFGGMPGVIAMSAMA